MTDSIREYTMAPGFEPIGQYVRGNDAVTGIQWVGEWMIIGFGHRPSLAIAHGRCGGWLITRSEQLNVIKRRIVDLKYIGTLIKDIGGNAFNDET